MKTIAVICGLAQYVYEFSDGLVSNYLNKKAAFLVEQQQKEIKYY